LEFIQYFQLLPNIRERKNNNHIELHLNFTSDGSAVFIYSLKVIY